MTEASLDLSAMARAGKPMASGHRPIPPTNAISVTGTPAI
jgi:hypothetical protein